MIVRKLEVLSDHENNPSLKVGKEGLQKCPSATPQRSTQRRPLEGPSFAFGVVAANPANEHAEKPSAMSGRRFLGVSVVTLGGVPRRLVREIRGQWSEIQLP